MLPVSLLALCAYGAAAASTPTAASSNYTVASGWFAAWHVADVPLSSVLWSKYTHMVYAFATPTADPKTIFLAESDEDARRRRRELGLEWSVMGRDAQLRTSETDSVSQGIELLKLKLKGSISGVWSRQSVTAAAEPMANGQPMPNADEQVGLLRRSEVLQHAEETGASLLEPSEMVQYAASQYLLYAPAEAKVSGSGSGSDTTATNVNTNGKGPNKRVHLELTPLPEEGDGDGAVHGVQSSPSRSLSDLPTAPARKQTRSNGDELEVAAGAAPNTRVEAWGY
ncbi:hypothetical protein GGX14DRAFT_696902 [Mycena pura]|uniref:Uncharacterized protein n=1 Tax=Mycena pura TaxID=153505 RepID=A0AAD6VH79_9AGAR|nr:hypothetical protein GGX14DRAFT_696902 [Mycena pura]